MCQADQPYLLLILLHLRLSGSELGLHQRLLGTQLLLHGHLHLPLVLKLHLLQRQHACQDSSSAKNHMHSTSFVNHPCAYQCHWTSMPCLYHNAARQAAAALKGEQRYLLHLHGLLLQAYSHVVVVEADSTSTQLPSSAKTTCSITASSQKSWSVVFQLAMTDVQMVYKLQAYHE